MRIAELRRAAGLTQAELAGKLGVVASAVGLWEIGACQPSSKRLPDLAAALGCTISDLFVAPDEPAES